MATRMTSVISRSGPPVQCSLVATFADREPTRRRTAVNGGTLRRSFGPAEGETGPRVRCRPQTRRGPAGLSCGWLLRITARDRPSGRLWCGASQFARADARPRGELRVTGRSHCKPAWLCTFRAGRYAGSRWDWRLWSYSAAAPKGMDGRCSPRTWGASAGDAENLTVDLV